MNKRIVVLGAVLYGLGVIFGFSTKVCITLTKAGKKIITEM